MKKKTIAFTILALVASSLFAQKFALQGAKDLLLNTKDLKLTEQVTQQFRDSNDSLCTVEIIMFEMPFKQRDLFKKIQQEYSNELPHSSSGYSRVAEWDAERRYLTEGVQRVSLYFAEGREPITTEQGSNFVCLRHNLPNPKYRTAVCIEWWKYLPEDVIKKQLSSSARDSEKIYGRIISVKGPEDKSVYGPTVKYFSLQNHPSKSPKILVKPNGSQLKVLSFLEKMYQDSNDENMREAINSSFNSQVKSYISLPTHKNEDMKELIQLLNKMPGYGVEVYESKKKPDGNTEWEPKQMTLDEVIEKYDSFKLFSLSWCDKGSPEVEADGEETKNGLLQIFLDK